MKNVLCVVLVLFSSTVWAQEISLDQKCQLLYERSGFCPQDVCQLICTDLSQENCPLECAARPCEELPVEVCPMDSCMMITGCGDEPVCYSQPVVASEECGGLAYFGDRLECCEGLTKRCGLEFFDGTCDMEGLHSIYSVPICVPCGNGICNQFENSCNCPEDCQRDKNILPLILGENG